MSSRRRKVAGPAGRLDLLGKLTMIDAWICAQPPLTRTGLRVLARLVQQQNVRTGQCNPSQEYLARKLGVTEKSIRNSVKELKGRGAIFVRGSRNRRNSYSFGWPLGLCEGNPTGFRNSRSDKEEGAYRPEGKTATSKKRSKKERKDRSEPCEDREIQSLVAGPDNAAHRRDYEKSSESLLEATFVNRFENCEVGYSALLAVDDEFLESVKSAYLAGQRELEEAVSELLMHLRNTGFQDRRSF